MEGKGVYAWGDGNHYVGMFRNGKQNGVGAYEWPTGGKYIGHWKDDKMHGFGTYKRDDGVVYFGMWEDDHQSGMGLKVVPARFCFSETLLPIHFPLNGCTLQFSIHFHCPIYRGQCDVFFLRMDLIHHCLRLQVNLIASNQEMNS